MFADRAADVSRNVLFTIKRGIFADVHRNTNII